ncbi:MULTISPECIES: energy-coupling factor transporter transmembrane protein EcfT [Cytobacillus]|jgi:energy-coupling factor transport system permease protein|uniref:Energy-coupling factor transporter transmembrane protein EcfT n=2 Tax=Cytobacillus TaxID=2675230 RepID=A0A160M780_9BACI|nr:MULTISPECIES: energy-coupling factor transporter transmembrane protein EcfT [Cytobacillus]EFV74226.1 YbaF protein [Bacillus sp. 2_A_57_CT2]MBY0155696.1 energy-coupling factor transporter transmembrane protein EcfT [Cytobacillus firmus]AND37788.1 cobalt ABC transporter permease [Cytobacillus oceanisediminis 2691]MBU8732993.1 energy-coupling factor transporter transmembrane protein EcfT [Cytobacillus oceanisediminis]MBU8773049.1 energy-coupling factor transporter transmembrane protein EcfT [C
MMDKMIFGRYVPAESVLHRMDPRSKLVLIFLFVCIVFLANNMLTYGLLTVYTFLMIALSKVPIRFIYTGLKPVLLLVIFTLFLHLFLTKEGEVLFRFGWITIYEEGLRQGIFISLRFFLLILMTSILTLTTTPIEITDGLESLLAPLNKIKFPVHELALMMSISLRFIPTLMQETDKIMKAQTARGVDFSSGPIKERIKAIIPLLIPLFVSSFKRAEELAVAMESRGYRGGEGRTKYRQLNWGLKDTAMLAMLAALTLVLILLRT